MRFVRLENGSSAPRSDAVWKSALCSRAPKKICPIALSPIKRETREVRVAPVSATQILTPQVPTAFDAVDLFVQDVVDDYRGRGFWRSEKISEESHHASRNGTGVE